ncbi:stalk domain-containing protein [Brevibacillus ginsengisoli]|uniref:stalk domain-containing protein n=1 Tax=Brevibacillus ginsengisoli TaxID=363854 RepID=UPI003CEDA9ED
MKKQPKKNLVTALMLAGVVATTVIPTTYASAANVNSVAVVQKSDIQIRINQALISVTDAKPYIDPTSNRTMVPLRVISEQLGAEVKWDANKRTVYIAKDNTQIHVQIDSKQADVDGKTVSLDAPAVIKASRTFVPLRFISEATGAQVDWNPTERLVSIQTKDAVSQPSGDTNTSGSTTDTSSNTSGNVGNTLSINQAVDSALANNSDLKAMKLDADTADLNSRLVYSNVKDIPSDFIDSLSMAQQKYVNEAKAEMAKRVNGYVLDATEQKIVLGAKKAYYDLLNAQADLDSKKQALTRSQTQLKQATAAYQVGTRAKTDVLQAEAGVAGANAALASAQNNLSIAQMKLNQFIGSPLDKQWVLKADQIDPANLTISKDQAVELALKQRAEVLQKQEEIKVAQLNVDLIEKYSSLSTYQGEMAKNEVSKANLTLEQTKQNVTIEVTQDYNNLHTGKVAMDANQKAVDASKENYRLTQLRYENGLSTTLEVIQAQEDLSNRENAYQSSVYNYNLAIISFENAMGKSSSAS